jgi:hypothetical protein
MPQPEELPRGALAELASHIIEIEMARREGVPAQVVFNAELPERETGTYRQVDSAMRYELAGRPYVRTVEARDRKRKIGPEFIDQIVGKAGRLGIHRTTIVSTAGYTSTALRRIEAQGELLDAVDLRPAKPADWLVRPPETSQIYFDDVPIAVQFETRAYCDAMSGARHWSIAYAPVGIAGYRGFVGLCERAPAVGADDPEVDLRIFLLGFGSEFAAVELDFEHSVDGKTGWTRNHYTLGPPQRFIGSLDRRTRLEP